MIKKNLSLQGKFSYKIFDESGNLKTEVNDISNFITSTGLTFPATYAFADCFRFISLGSGTSSNTLLGSFGGTTGLSIPLSKFSYIGSRTNYGDTTTIQYENPSCGYTESEGQLTLSRGWKIPNAASTFDGNYTFNELMLSPGTPSGINRQCGCAGGDISNGGVDASIVADYYDTLSTPSICSAHQAFTRIVLNPPITVNIRDFLVVNYNLNINYDTGVDLFAKNTNQTFSTNWSGIVSGRSNIIHHGLKLINNGNVIDESQYRNQVQPNGEDYNWLLEYGESFVPIWGAPLEPSSLQNNLIAYLSTDNVQFLVNQISGGHLDTTLWQPYNSTGFLKSSGLLSFISNPSKTTDPRFFNIRTNLTGPIYPAQIGVLADGSPQSDINFIIHSSFGRNNLLPYTASGRTRTGLYSVVFTNLNSFNWKNGVSPTPLVRSMVLNYSDTIANGANTMYPFLDILFSGTHGEGLVPTGSDYSYSTSSSDYFYVGGGGDLTLSFALSWSSPCSSDTIGC